jgi:hypothetical protein
MSKLRWCSRERAISDLVPFIGRLVLHDIQARMPEIEFPTVQSDGWSSHLGDRFEGILVSGIVRGEWVTMVLATRHIEEMHETAAVVAQLMADVLSFYRVRPLFGTSDTAALMKRAYVILGLAEATEGLEWLPCLLHLINLIMQAFMNAIPELIALIKKFRQKLCGPTFFRTFCEAMKSARCVVPTIYE